eukprot:g18977.t2
MARFELSKDQVLEQKQAFDVLDLDGNGKITFQEVKELRPMDLSEQFITLDIDGNNIVTFPEFLKVFVKGEFGRDVMLPNVDETIQVTDLAAPEVRPRAASCTLDPIDESKIVMKLSKQKSAGYYVRAAKQMLTGSQDKAAFDLEPDQAALQHSLAEGDKIIPETVFGEDADPVILRLQKGKHPGVILSQSYENTDVYGGGVVISDYAPNGEVAKKITDPTGAHVLEIDQRDVSHWNLISVMKLWNQQTKKVEKGRELHYTVKLAAAPVPPAHWVLFVTGLLPACLALLIILGTLPCFLWNIWMGTALEDVEPREAVEGNPLEPAPRLKSCWLVFCIESRITRFSLILFFSSNVCWRFWLSWRIFPLEPLSEVLDVVREGLMLAMCIVLEFGQMATEANELVVDKKDEPENSEEKQKEIRRRKRRWSRATCEVTKVTRKVHEEAVNLAQDVLPALQKIGASALGFAVVSWTYSFLWLFGFVAVDFDKILKHWVELAIKLLGIMLTSLPLGLLCLIPPALVSDACGRLLMELNQLRSLEKLKDDVQLRKTERYIQDRTSMLMGC